MRSSIGSSLWVIPFVALVLARRLRGMIEDLIANLPERRHPPRPRELRLRDETIDRLYLSPDDRALARAPDMQGLGGGSVIGRG
jgi:hypothetical protein